MYGVAEGLKESSRGGAEGMAGFGGADRRGSLDEDTDSLMDRDGGNDSFMQEWTSGEEGGQGGSVLQLFGHSSSSSFTITSSGLDVIAGAYA